MQTVIIIGLAIAEPVFQSTALMPLAKCSSAAI
jgi:hypothetical protein